MTPATTFAGREVALFGLGGSGLATALALKAGGATVVACDDNPARMQEAEKQGIATRDLKAADWSRFAALVLSPGVPLTHPEPHWSVRLAQGAGVEIIGDVELFCRERERLSPQAPFIAITGTNGKSTTTALVAHILRQAGRDVQLGGNIGTAILSLAPPAEDRFHVIEMSSFQIDLTPSLRPSVGALINLSPDHLDRHGTMENYAAIKERLVANAAFALIGVDDPFSAAIYEREARRHRGGGGVYPVSIERFLDFGISLEGDMIVARTYPGEKRVLANLAGISTLRGRHNAQNACFAAAVADLYELAYDDEAVIQRGLSTFPGLPHRMEAVGRLGNILFVNDSKATNADSTEKALASFDRILWIVGGKPKEGGIESLRPYFPRIDKAYLIGEASEAFAGTLEGEVPYLRCGTLERALAAAAEDARASTAPEPVVLLSPACASYDQFKNFEERGDRFRTLVQGLPGIEAKG